jgi:hypothetical protein
MKYMGLAIASLAIVLIHILGMDRKAAVKRTAFRWYVIIVSLLLLLFLSLVAESLVLLVFVIPVLVLMDFIWLKYTRFCEWCGRATQTNLPFVNKHFCPRCGARFL